MIRKLFTALVAFSLIISGAILVILSAAAEVGIYLLGLLVLWIFLSLLGLLPPPPLDVPATTVQVA